MSKMNTVNLYNNDGTLSIQAQLLLSPKPDNVSMTEWRKLMKEFKSLLSVNECIEFSEWKKSARCKTYREANKEAIKTQQKSYYHANKEVVKQKVKARGNCYTKAYAERNKEKIKLYREENKEITRARYRLNGYAKAYRERNKEKLKAREAEKRQTPKGKLRKAITAAFERIGKNKPTNSLELLGCSWQEAKAHIESLWQEGMSWENHGRYGWHIDHIRPVSSFEYHELDQMNHISNLQPLWAKDNLEKKDRWIA
jgi:hypothetical protein